MNLDEILPFMKTVDSKEELESKLTEVMASLVHESHLGVYNFFAESFSFEPEFTPDQIQDIYVNYMDYSREKELKELIKKTKIKPSQKTVDKFLLMQANEKPSKPLDKFFYKRWFKPSEEGIQNLFLAFIEKHEEKSLEHFKRKLNADVSKKTMQKAYSFFADHDSFDTIHRWADKTGVKSSNDIIAKEYNFKLAKGEFPYDIAEGKARKVTLDPVIVKKSFRDSFKNNYFNRIISLSIYTGLSFDVSNKEQLSKFNELIEKNDFSDVKEFLNAFNIRPYVSEEKAQEKYLEIITKNSHWEFHKLQRAIEVFNTPLSEEVIDKALKCYVHDYELDNYKKFVETFDIKQTLSEDFVQELYFDLASGYNYRQINSIYVELGIKPEIPEMLVQRMYQKSGHLYDIMNLQKITGIAPNEKSLAAILDKKISEVEK